MKDESPIVKEWSRWSTSFSSVPALTHWERETVDWSRAGRKRSRDRKTKEVNVCVCTCMRVCPSIYIVHVLLGWWGLHAAVWPPLCRSLHPPLPPPQWTVKQRNNDLCEWLCAIYFLFFKIHEEPKESVDIHQKMNVVVIQRAKFNFNVCEVLSLSFYWTKLDSHP